MTNHTITVTLSESKKQKPLTEQLEFGRIFTDHMFVADYCEGQGWTDHRIVPYAPLEMDPAATIFHYGQTIFEGLKAYVGKDGQVLLFRPEENMRRMNKSSDRLCMPLFDEEIALEALNKLILVDKD